MKIVMCFGTFDILHLGHLYYFEQAKKHGDYLLVVIARDKTKQQQGKKIIFSETQRLKMVQSLKIVDEAVLGNVVDHLQVILDKKPAVVCLGYDHGIPVAELKQKLALRKLYPFIVRIKSYQPKQYKSSKIKQYILNTS